MQELPKDRSQCHLCSVSPWLRLTFFFNCLIIHLRALIYPPPSALYVRPLSETFGWISDELVAWRAFLAERAPIYGHVCLLFIKINPLGKPHPYADNSRALPGTSLGRESRCFSWYGLSVTPPLKPHDNSFFTTRTSSSQHRMTHIFAWNCLPFLEIPFLF